MSQVTSHYPISQFIESLGYRNIERGLRRAPTMDRHGKRVRAHHQTTRSELSAHPDDIQRAVAATAEIQAAEAQAAWVESLKADADTFRLYI